jgi:hypothetical protein
MDEITTLIVFFAGVLLRIGIPVALTIVLIWAFAKLDARWKREAALHASERPASAIQARNTGCWKVHGCSEEGRKRCPAYNRLDLPCWQVFRREDGQLKERCLGCQVFANAPLPVSGD